MSPPRPRAALPVARRSLSGLFACLMALGSVVLRGNAQPAPMPDFRLTDVNPNSTRHTQSVSPRDYRLQISAYYFGAAG